MRSFLFLISLSSTLTFLTNKMSTPKQRVTRSNSSQDSCAMTSQKSPVSFESVRRLSASKINKLSKEQLCNALHDAIQIDRNRSTGTRDVDTLDTMGVASLVTQQINSMIQPLLTQFQQLMFDYRTLSNEVKELREDYSNAREVLCEEILDEVKERQKRRKYIILSCVEELYQGTVEERLGRCSCCEN